MADMTKTALKTITPELGLSDKNRKGVVEIFKALLADEHVLYMRLRNYHWNVTGPQFRSLHELFEEQYTQLATVIDEAAERIRTYGVMAPGTMKEMAQLARLKEKPGEYPNARQMVKDLVADHETIVRCLRDDIEQVSKKYGDVGAEDFLTGLLQSHQEMAWMLRTILEGEPVHK
jgi:starvation-inducible DNA-binding protein